MIIEIKDIPEGHKIERISIDFSSGDIDVSSKNVVQSTKVEDMKFGKDETQLFSKESIVAINELDAPTENTTNKISPDRKAKPIPLEMQTQNF